MQTPALTWHTALGLPGRRALRPGVTPWKDPMSPRQTCHTATFLTFPSRLSLKMGLVVMANSSVLACSFLPGWIPAQLRVSHAQRLVCPDLGRVHLFAISCLCLGFSPNCWPCLRLEASGQSKAFVHEQQLNCTDQFLTCISPCHAP